jgi:hypothetical protein
MTETRRARVVLRFRVTGLCGWNSKGRSKAMEDDLKNICNLVPAAGQETP